MFSISNYITLFAILIVLGFVYKKLEQKRLNEEDIENYNVIKKYLLNDTKTLGKAKKPILWIHIPYEYNARNWKSFGSRSSHELNQPYLYLTVKSIIDQCQDSFYVCMIDDKSFSKLIPEWDININRISSPISNKIRMLALANILYIYGGMILPISFLCLKDLAPLYNSSIRGDRMFICENIDRNTSSTYFKFYPDTKMMGAPRKNENVLKLINHIQTVVSTDFTAESHILGNVSHWCEDLVQKGEIHLVDGRLIGVKDTEGEPIMLEELLGDDFIQLYPDAYGIYIPAMEILKRRKYEWFARLSPKQVLQAKTILSEYFKLAIGPYSERGVIEPLEVQPPWIQFWKTPLTTVWGQKPNFLGDNLLTSPY